MKVFVFFFIMNITLKTYRETSGKFNRRSFLSYICNERADSKRNINLVKWFHSFHGSFHNLIKETFYTYVTVLCDTKSRTIVVHYFKIYFSC